MMSRWIRTAYAAASLTAFATYLGSPIGAQMSHGPSICRTATELIHHPEVAIFVTVEQKVKRDGVSCLFTQSVAHHYGRLIHSVTSSRACRNGV